MKWILNHMRIVAAILVFGITAVIIGVVMISSYTSYQAYEKKYNANDLELRSALAAAPKKVEINDQYKSKYANNYTTNVEAGAVQLDLYLDAKSFADIEVVFNYNATENLLANMNIKVNDSLVEEEGIKIEEENAGEHHLVMSNFALPEGDLKVTIASVKGKTMPEIKSIAVYASAKVSAAA